MEYTKSFLPEHCATIEELPTELFEAVQPIEDTLNKSTIRRSIKSFPIVYTDKLIEDLQMISFD